MASSPPMFDADTFETKYEPAAKSEYLISFAKPGSHTVATGIHGIDMDHRQNLRLNTSTEHVDELQSKAIINTWGDSKLYTASMSWVRVSNENPYGIQAGRFDGSPSNRTTKITFARPYEQPPSVVAWLSGLDLGCKGNWRLKTEAKDITREGFTLSLDTWSDTQWFSASANWIAHHADHHGIFSGSYNTEQVRPWNKPTSETHGSLTFPKSFEKPPYIITALTSIDFAHDQNIRFKMSTTNITKAGFAWGLDTWDVSTLYSATASYIAFDQSISVNGQAPKPCAGISSGAANSVVAGSTIASSSGSTLSEEAGKNTSSSVSVTANGSINVSSNVSINSATNIGTGVGSSFVATIQVVAGISIHGSSIIAAQSTADELDEATFQIILKRAVYMTTFLSGTTLNHHISLALGSIARPVGALASIAFGFAGIYAGMVAATGAGAPLTTFLSTKWEQLESLGVFKYTRSSYQTTTTVKGRERAIFAEAASAAILAMQKDKQELLGLCKGIADVDSIFEAELVKSQREEWSSKAESALMAVLWMKKEGMEFSQVDHEKLGVKIIESEMATERVAEWAIIAEAALTAVLSMKRERLEALGVLRSMKKTLKKLNPFIQGVAPRIMGSITKPALRITLDMLYKKTSPGVMADFCSIYPDGHESSSASDSEAGNQAYEPFLNKLFSKVNSVPGTGQFGRLRRPLFGRLNKVASNNIISVEHWGTAGSTVINQRMAEGLSLLLPKGFSDPNYKTPDLSTTTEPLEGAAERAMLAEAALAAVMMVPVEHFDESFWKTMTITINQIAPVVLRAAPGIYSNLGLVVRGLMGPCPWCQSQPALPTVSDKMYRPKPGETFGISDTLEEEIKASEGFGAEFL